VLVRDAKAGTGPDYQNTGAGQGNFLPTGAGAWLSRVTGRLGRSGNFRPKSHISVDAVPGKGLPGFNVH
jgi:hypothetical protein